MYKIEENETLCRIINILYFVGIWPKDDESAFRKAGKKFCHAFVLVLFLIFLATHAILSDDQNESLFLGQTLVLMAVVSVKFLNLVFKKQEILELLYDPIFSHSTQSHKEYEDLNEKMRKFMKFIHFYLFTITVSSLITIVSELPIFSADKELPLLTSSSWNDSEILYWSAFVFIALSLFLGLIINLLTVIIWVTMLNYSIEYQILGNNFTNLGWEIKEDTKKKVDQKKLSQKQFVLPLRNFFVENLIVLVKAHQTLTKYNFLILQIIQNNYRIQFY